MHRRYSGGLAVALLVLAHGVVNGAGNAEPIIEIEVRGQRTLLQLRQELYAAEDAMYGLWNELNDDDLFDIHCVEKAHSNTKIKVKQCLPRFVSEASQHDARDYMDQALSAGGTVTLGNPDAEVQKYTPVYRQKMKDMILQNPAMLEAALKHARALQALEGRDVNSPDPD